MAKAYFTPELFQFLKQLKRNNRREWFLKNKDRYEEVVKQPCLRFITDFGLRLPSISTWIVANPKPNGGSLMRIYRDTRFSPDKTPYKTNVGVSFWHAGSSRAPFCSLNCRRSSTNPHASLSFAWSVSWNNRQECGFTAVSSPLNSPKTTCAGCCRRPIREHHDVFVMASTHTIGT